MIANRDPFGLFRKIAPAFFYNQSQGVLERSKLMLLSIIN